MVLFWITTTLLKKSQHVKSSQLWVVLITRFIVLFWAKWSFGRIKFGFNMSLWDYLDYFTEGSTIILFRQNDKTNNNWKRATKAGWTDRTHLKNYNTSYFMIILCLDFPLLVLLCWLKSSDAMCVLAPVFSGREIRLAEKVLGNCSAPAGCLQDLARVADKPSRLHRSHYGRDVRFRILNLKIFVCGPTNFTNDIHNI